MAEVMQFITSHRGRLQHLGLSQLKAGQGNAFATRLPELDQLAPLGGFARGAVHELLCESSHHQAFSVALLLAQAASTSDDPLSTNPTTLKLPAPTPNLQITSPIVWCDPTHQLYPPALAAAGVPLNRLFILQPKTPADLIWAIAESLRCKGVGATVAAVSHLSRIQARRLQLAAESGGGAGILLRPLGPASTNYAAATRWLVTPARGTKTVQRWNVQLIHGHGGQLNKTILLEMSRETNHVRAVAPLVDRSASPQTAGLSA